MTPSEIGRNGWQAPRIAMIRTGKAVRKRQIGAQITGVLRVSSWMDAFWGDCNPRRDRSLGLA